MQIPLFRLQCGTNSYEWGKVGKESAAARFAAATNFTIEEDKPYAELWMGTHPSNPSKDLDTDRSLLELVQENQMLLSPSIAKRFENRLPFLFKVLSIQKALSIQAHPNKKLAEQLHERDSKNYPDDNHKPEMTIAITPFEGLCGFRPLEEITYFLQNIPSLRELVGDDESQALEEAIEGHGASEDGKKKALKNAFASLMKSSSEEIEREAPILVKQAKDEGEKFAGGGGNDNTGKELADLTIRSNDQFPNDLGLFVTFFLNYVKLAPGEAMFLKADDIHAYLSGDIMECMAASDNVVRAGFTPKFKDVSTLTSMLTYDHAPIAEQKMEPIDYPYCKLNQAAFSSDSSCLLYDPPIPEFAVLRTELKSDGAKVTYEPVEGPSIVICTSGKGKISVGPKTEEIKEGYVYFVGATAELIVESTADEPFVTFKAFCELDEGAENGFSGKM